MKTFKKILSVGATLIMTASISSVYAEEGTMNQTRTQDRVRTELNLQMPASDYGQSQNREEHTVMAKSENQNQYQNQHRYMNKYQYGDTASGKQTMKTQGTENNIWQGNTADSSMNRVNTTNRSMQGNTMTGSMNRYSTASRSMAGGRR